MRLQLPDAGANFDPVTYFGADLLCYFDAGLGITMGGTLRAAGTSPPALTVSGTAAGVYGLRIECTKLGARGTWEFRWSLNNGTTWAASNVVSAATQALGSTGITLAIAAGNAAVDNVWKATCSQWSDQSISANHAAQGTAANQPEIIASGTIAGTPTIRGDGVARFMNLTYNITATPFTIFVVTNKFNDTAAAQVPIHTSLVRIYTRGTGADGGWFVLGSGTKATGVVTTSTLRVLEIVSRASTDNDLITDGGSLVNGSVGATYLSAATTSLFGGQLGLTIDGDIASAAIVSGTISSDSRRLMRQYMGNRAGIAVAP
jgi:hypothetical protein